MISTRRILHLFQLLALFSSCFYANAQSSVAEPQTVSFPSGDEILQGYLWVPEGKGPFRAIVWNFGNKQRLLKQGPPSQFNALAKLYLENDYILFIPDRVGSGEEETNGKDKGGKFVASAASKNSDLIAALSWLRQQSFVDAGRVAVSGTMTGGVQSWLAVERDATIRAAVIFSPGSVSWDGRAELRTMLQSTAENTEVPVFLIQPQNDKTLGPSEILGRILAKKGGLNRAKVYPPYSGDARTFAMDGVEIWGRDVLTFIDSTMK